MALHVSAERTTLTLSAVTAFRQWLPKCVRTQLTTAVTCSLLIMLPTGGIPCCPATTTGTQGFERLVAGERRIGPGTGRGLVEHVAAPTGIGIQFFRLGRKRSPRSASVRRDCAFLSCAGAAGAASHSNAAIAEQQLRIDRQVTVSRVPLIRPA